MITVPGELRERLRRLGQEHVLAFWDRLGEGERQEILAQLQALDLDQLRQLYAQRGQAHAALDASRIRPVPVIPHDSADAEERRRLGEEALRRGEVAALVVAGGQGSRLGFDHPKGMY